MPDHSDVVMDLADFRPGSDMDERKMSVMQRLRAIRDRMSAQNEFAPAGSAGPTDAAVADPHAAEASAPASPGAGQDSHAFGATPGRAASVPAQGTSNMWDMINEDEAPLDDDGPLPGLDDFLPDLPEPLSFAARHAATEQRGTPVETPRRTGRVKTRLLGFDHSSGQSTDVFERVVPSPTVQGVRFPVGWLVVVDGPGRGASIALQNGVAQIGREEGQGVQLDFGDTSISRTNHAAIAYDEEARGFFVGHGGKSNLVRLNGKPLLSTERMTHGDTLLIGETKLRLVALCGEHFSWAGAEETPPDSSA